jgi:AraC-like DNA-binding protein
VVRPVREDARGIVAPEVGLEHFRLDRYPPSERAGRFVDRYWVSTWDLRGRPPFTQQVLDRPAAAITDAVLPVAEVFGPPGEALGQDLAAAADAAAMAELADRFLAALAPRQPQPSEATTAIAERAAADPSLMRVDGLAAAAGLGLRALQRRFADHVGISAKAFIRRYRLYEAAEQARLQRAVDWAELAARLGYSDQSHLSREFSALLGTPPRQYLLHLLQGATPGPPGSRGNRPARRYLLRGATPRAPREPGKPPG